LYLLFPGTPVSSTNKADRHNIQSMDISIRHSPCYAIYIYIFHIKYIFPKTYCEVISKQILIIFAPEEAEIFKDYLFILA
jgi:hypothetical protein